MNDRERITRVWKRLLSKMELNNRVQNNFPLFFLVGWIFVGESEFSQI